MAGRSAAVDRSSSLLFTRFHLHLGLGVIITKLTPPFMIWFLLQEHKMVQYLDTIKHGQAHLIVIYTARIAMVMHELLFFTSEGAYCLMKTIEVLNSEHTKTRASGASDHVLHNKKMIRLQQKKIQDQWIIMHL
ncbi:hypothetical protein ACJX0J_031800, partial [Zea mays]